MVYGPYCGVFAFPKQPQPVLQEQDLLLLDSSCKPSLLTHWPSSSDQIDTMQFRLSLVCSRFHLNGPTTGRTIRIGYFFGSRLGRRPTATWKHLFPFVDNGRHLGTNCSRYCRSIGGDAIGTIGIKTHFRYHFFAIGRDDVRQHIGSLD